MKTQTSLLAVIAITVLTICNINVSKAQCPMDVFNDTPCPITIAYDLVDAGGGAQCAGTLNIPAGLTLTIPCAGVPCSLVVTAYITVTHINGNPVGTPVAVHNTSTSHTDNCIDPCCTGGPTWTITWGSSTTTIQN